MGSPGAKEMILKSVIKNLTPLWVVDCLRLLRSVLLLGKYHRKMAGPASYIDDSDRWAYLLFKGKAHLIAAALRDRTFEWDRLDDKLFRKLSEVIPSGRQGCLFNQGNRALRVRSQVNFLASIVKATQPKRILEIGTYTALFCYAMHLCNDSVTIDTFGDLPESQKAVDLLNVTSGPYIRYHLGDSRETLRVFSPGYRIDFAWVDGGHSYTVCLSDLTQCKRLGIPFIAVDDYKWSLTVREAVKDFLAEGSYAIEKVSDLLDYRGIAFITNRSANG